MRQKHVRPLPFRRIFATNLLIIAASVILGVAQFFGSTETLLPSAPSYTQTPIPTSGVLRNAASQPTRVAVVPTTDAPATPTLRATRIGVPTHTPTTVATPTAARLTHTLTVVATPTPTTVGTPTPVISTSWPITQVLGRSTLGWPIEAYQFGNGPIRLAFIGGIHGGYEWNTILLAFEAIDHFTAHRDFIPASVTIYIVPSANPDGQVRVVNHAGRFTADEVSTETVPGRFNGNDVDLNRNWDQNWTPAGIWGAREVSAGDAPFSEVETQILRDFLASMHSVVFWHSARPGVYVAFCHDPYPPSQVLAAVYAKAAQYPLYVGFYDYAVTGNATDWLACEGIPAIAVELTNHRATDAKQNLAAMRAVIREYTTRWNLLDH